MVGKEETNIYRKIGFPATVFIDFLSSNYKFILKFHLGISIL